MKAARGDDRGLVFQAAPTELAAKNAKMDYYADGFTLQADQNHGVGDKFWYIDRVFSLYARIFNLTRKIITHARFDHLYFRPDMRWKKSPRPVFLTCVGREAVAPRLVIVRDLDLMTTEGRSMTASEIFRQYKPNEFGQRLVQTVPAFDKLPEGMEKTRLKKVRTHVHALWIQELCRRYVSSNTSNVCKGTASSSTRNMAEPTVIPMGRNVPGKIMTTTALCFRHGIVSGRLTVLPFHPTLAWTGPNNETMALKHSVSLTGLTGVST